ncbi:hypothetical protein GCM10009734_23410 [Nonomuraea bangladeshensis]
MLQAAPCGDGLGSRAEVGEGECEGGDLGGRQRASIVLHDCRHTQRIRTATDIFRKPVRKDRCPDTRKRRVGNPPLRTPDYFDSCDRSREAPVEAEVVIAA